MNQQGFIVPVIIAVVIVLALGVGAAMYFSGQEEGAEEIGDGTKELEISETTETSNSFTGTVADLLQSGQNLTCTFSQAGAAGNVTTGTVYVAGQNMRGDFVGTNPDGTTMNAHVVRDGGYNYFWADGLPQGTKTAVTEDEVSSSQKSEKELLDDTANYSCNPWIVDSSVFTLPADREFVDISQQVQQINSATQDVQQTQCSACDQIEGPGKEQCLKTLGCV